MVNRNICKKNKKNSNVMQQCKYILRQNIDPQLKVICKEHDKHNHDYLMIF